MKHIYKEEQIDAIVLESLLGLDTELNISQKYDISLVKLRRWIKESKERTGLISIEVAESQYEDIIKDYKADFKLKMVHRYLSGQDSFQDVAEEFNLPNAIILAQWVHQFRQGKKFRDGRDQVEWVNFRSRKISTEEEEEVFNEILSGKVYRQVAHEHRISLYQVQGIVKRYKEDQD